MGPCLSKNNKIWTRHLLGFLIRLCLENQSQIIMLAQEVNEILKPDLGEIRRGCCNHKHTKKVPILEFH